MATVLVSGAGGYIGTLLCEALLKDGHTVLGLDRYFFGKDKLGAVADNPNFRLLVDDTRFFDPKILQGVECLFDLAGLSNDASAEIDPQLTVSINTNGAIRMAKLAKEAGVRRYIYSSSASVYGQGKKRALREGDELHPQTQYALSKVAVEEAVFPLNSPDFLVTALRHSTVFGMARRMRFDLAVNVMTMRAWKERVIYIMGGGEQWRPFVHVRDVVQAFMRVFNAEPSVISGEVFNVGDESQNFQIKQLAKFVVDAIPNVTTYTIPDDVDKRTYNLNFDKIRDQLGFKINMRVPDGVREVKEGLEQGLLDPDDPTAVTLQWYKNILEWDKRIQDLSMNGKLLAP